MNAPNDSDRSSARPKVKRHHQNQSTAYSKDQAERSSVIDLSRIEDEVMQMKLGQRESTLMIGNFSQKLKETENNLCRNLSKSVERLASQLEGI